MSWLMEAIFGAHSACGTLQLFAPCEALSQDGGDTNVCFQAPGVNAVSCRAMMSTDMRECVSDD